MTKNMVLEVWGDFACWSRPEAKVERLTYPVPTHSGMRGLLSAIYSKPKEFYWQIKRIEVLKPIRYVSFRRNEVKSKVNKPFLVEENRTQRQTIALQDVRYRVTAAMVPQRGFEGSEKAFEAQFEKRCKRGQCFFQPSFGLREFAAYFEYGSSGLEPIRDNMDLGYMVYETFDLQKWKVTKKTEPYVSVFCAYMKNGVIEFPDFDSIKVLKPKAVI